MLYFVKVHLKKHFIIKISADCRDTAILSKEDCTTLKSDALTVPREEYFYCY